MKRVFLVASLALMSRAPDAEAYLQVEDIPHYLLSTIQQVVNYAQYVEHSLNQLTQIANQVTQIENQVIGLKRFGDPAYYVGLLHLDQIRGSFQALGTAVDSAGTLSSNSVGYSALGYTNFGIYPSYQGMVTKYGDPIQWEQDAFRKFGAVNGAYQQYNQGMVTYNQQLKALQDQYQALLEQYNREDNQMARQALATQMAAIKAQEDVLAHKVALQGQLLEAQHLQNQNAAALSAEAERQKMVQERATELQRAAGNLGTWIGGPGTNGTGVLP
jgi:hypothetical protein